MEPQPVPPLSRYAGDVMVAKFILRGARRRLTPRLNPFSSLRTIFLVVRFLARIVGIWPKHSRARKGPRAEHATPGPRTRPLGDGGHIDIRRLLAR
jgi:hypothetical protein